MTLDYKAIDQLARAAALPMTDAELDDMRAAVTNVLTNTPAYTALEWDIARTYDRLLATIDHQARALAATMEDVRDVLYETECDPPVYGLTRDQAAKIANALMENFQIRRKP